MSVYWRGALVDERTADMMDEVVRLCGPDVNIRPTQGSYSGGVSASAGTHNGCGALDLAGQDAGMTQYDRELIRNAQRMVGFASWIRDPSQSDWPWHIHCEAVQSGGKWDQGCLSSGAHGQVVDYYEGRNGLASGAADDGPRDYVGTTWETYGGTKPPPPLPADPTRGETVASAVINGHLNVFVIDEYGHIQQNIAGDSAWSGWLSGIPGDWSHGLTADAQGNDVSLFGVLSDGNTVAQVWSSESAWHGPVPFPGVSAK